MMLYLYYQNNGGRKHGKHDGKNNNNIELGNDKIKINYFGKNKEDDRWVDDSNDKLKKQVLIYIDIDSEKRK